ncbi:sodium channel regulatory subunit beta-3 isoform X3 [Sparus aurata]|uniref:sodium channel regulatory subunit beta-3 isoform X3 n=1 Tax=Sparus aurata TaxID=8175 RepID=UPI0011C1509E|nr:sodium channel subunit beta-3 isoform X3 [Sparus aurata]XP_030258820.1 sodium channel subunit beta-3 isoform X3 [Sparus aurata]
MSRRRQFGDFQSHLRARPPRRGAVRGPEVISAPPPVSLLTQLQGSLQQVRRTRSTSRPEKEPNMITHTRVHLQTLVLLFFAVHLSQPVCVEVPSATEAVLGKPMMLTCIACLRREEIKPKTTVQWFFMPNTDDITEEKTAIYKYEGESPVELDGPFKGRLTWKGSQDLQDVSIEIKNVTFNDSGVYECIVLREFEFDFFTPSVSVSKDIKLRVKEKVKGLIQTNYFAI